MNSKIIFCCAVASIFVTGCKPRLGDSNESEIKNDEVSSSRQVVAIPDGLKGDERSDYYHISEGSDMYPMLWMENLDSLFAPDTPFLEGLDQRFNVLIDDESPKYPFKYIGLTAAWSDADPTEADFNVQRDGKERVRPIAGTGDKSVAMVGVNCSFCHTGALSVDGKAIRIDGAPNLIDVRGFFSELAGGTVAMMLNEKKLQTFLERFPASRPRAATKAAKMVSDFKEDLGLGSSFKVADPLVDALFRLPHLQPHAKHRVQKILHAKKNVTAMQLKRLFNETYGFWPSHTISARINYLADMIGGNGPTLETAAGHSRTDAFGRISNLVLRKKSKIDLDAPVSIPHLWGFKYTALLQWNANTNSVLMRNVGQALGLGAIITNPEKNETTINVHNLDRLESLAYKIAVPNWSEHFGVPESDSIKRGCEVYYQNCASCHEGAPHVGPKGTLIDYKMTKLTEIGTDQTLTKNLTKPVEGQAFKDSIHLATIGIINQYFKTHNIDKETQDKWMRTEHRGKEAFRDTLLGETSHVGDLAYINIEAGMGYPARHLAGIWASAPFLHNGSVPTLWHLLTPSARPKRFFVGSRVFDSKLLGYSYELDEAALSRAAKGAGSSGNRQDACERLPAECFDSTQTGNSNRGHDYGSDLADADKFALIDFMKVLRPEAEYSWNTPPLYSYNGGQCQSL
jgi:hypothetical protein